MVNRKSRQTAEVALYHRRQRLTSNPTQPPRPLSRSSPVADHFMQPIWCTLSKAHSHASLRSHPFQVSRRYDLSEASLQVLHEALPPILDLHIKFLPYDAACHPQITYLRLTSLFSSRRSSTLRPVLSRRTSSGQGTCLQRSGYSSHQDGLCCYGVRELSDFTDRRLIKQQTRPCDDIRLRRLLWNSVIGHYKELDTTPSSTSGRVYL